MLALTYLSSNRFTVPGNARADAGLREHVHPQGPNGVSQHDSRLMAAVERRRKWAKQRVAPSFGRVVDQGAQISATLKALSMVRALNRAVPTHVLKLLLPFNPDLYTEHALLRYVCWVLW
jgi:hypothetical protein